MSRSTWARNVLFVAATLFGFATFALYWQIRENVSFSAHPIRVVVMVGLGVLAGCCGAAGSLVAERVRRRG